MEENKEVQRIPCKEIQCFATIIATSEQTYPQQPLLQQMR